MGAPLAVVSQHHNRHHHHHNHHHHHHGQGETTVAAAVTKRPAAATLRRHSEKAMQPQVGGLIRVEVYADLHCPWCFIEKHSLEEVIERYSGEHPEVRFEVTWKPFYVNPLLKKGIDKRTMYETHWQNPPLPLSRIQSAGSLHGITFSLRGRTGSTRPAHKLIALALQELGPAGQSRVVEQLLRGHFEAGRDVADEAWLAELGAAAGIPEAIVRLELEDEDAGRRVDAAVEEARELRGVEAVPCVMVQGKYKVGGYQEGHVFESLFEKMRLAGEF